jgi:TonB family protein
MQSKYLLISCATHGLLVFLLVVGSAFAPSRRASTDDLPIIDFIPDMTTDEKAFGGGEPGPPPAPGPKPQTIQSLPAAPVEVRKPEPPQVKEPVIKPDPKPETKPDPEPVTKKEEVKQMANPDDVAIDPPKQTVKPPKKERELNLSPVTRATDTKETAAAKKKEKDAADKRAREEAAEIFNQQIGQSLGKIKNGLSAGVSLAGVVGGKGSGTGTGGPSYANWKQTVVSIYDNAFVAPDNVADASLTVRVKIVVSRDGTIVSDSIVNRSGSASLDRAVSSVLQRIRSVPRFPDGATDERRTILINFNIHGRPSAA